MNIKQANPMPPEQHIGLKLLIIRLGEIVCVTVFQRVTAQYGKVEHLVLTHVADGIRMRWKLRTDTIPGQQIVVRAFLQAYHIGVKTQHGRSSRAESVGTEGKIVNIPRGYSKCVIALCCYFAQGKGEIMFPKRKVQHENRQGKESHP